MNVSLGFPLLGNSAPRPSTNTILALNFHFAVSSSSTPCPLYRVLHQFAPPAFRAKRAHHHVLTVNARCQHVGRLSSGRHRMVSLERHVPAAIRLLRLPMHVNSTCVAYFTCKIYFTCRGPSSLLRPGIDLAHERDWVDGVVRRVHGSFSRQC
jgi:hypothetical protein